jgi:protein-S-isoprenylcysteine O-methyltransferase Ste14
MFYVIFFYILIFSILNLLLYWSQLKNKTLTKIFGKKDFVAWLVFDLGGLIILSILLIVFFVFYPQPEIFSNSLLLKMIGLVIAIPGFFISLFASKKIGFLRSFSQAIFTRKKYKVIKVGVFKYFTHPMYFGWFLIFVGTIIFFNSLYALIFTIEGSIYMTIRSKIEECELEYL